MLQEFNNRIFGAVILKSINSNFNADFTHHPRTLPDGVVYSTDKALKYTIKDFFKKLGNESNLFFTKRLNENLNPLTLDETFIKLFGEFPTSNKDDVKRKEVLEKLLTSLDIRLFGATFAGKANISIHGPLQINHGVNKFPENDIYMENILSPFADKEGAQMSTLGNQTNLKEGHYVFHFSINPKNTKEFYEMVNKEKPDEQKLCLSTSDISKLKEALNSAVTALDSSRKIGTENEATVWVQLNENSKKVLPSFTELINVSKENEIIVIDLSNVESNLAEIDSDIEKVEIFYNPTTTNLLGCAKNDKTKHFNILNNKEI
jgi:CRISPR-associated protein Csh2